MTNKETLHNYLKVEMIEDKNLYNNYMNHIDDAIKNYSAIMILNEFETPQQEMEYICSELEYVSEMLEDALNSKKEYTLMNLYSLHVRVVAIECIKNRLEYFSPLQILEEFGE